MTIIFGSDMGASHNDCEEVSNSEQSAVFERRMFNRRSNR